MQHLEDTSTSYSVSLAIIGYSLCSSSLLLMNKLALQYIHFPSVLSLIQIVTATIFVISLKYVFKQEVDGFEYEKVKAYSLYIFAFVSCIYCNMKALEASNVETVIVFRACTPICVSVIDYVFMGREWPSTKSQLSLFLVALGAIMYCMTDSQFAMDGMQAYTWVTLYLVLIVFEMTYGKSLTSNVKMDSVWGPVLYCNALSILPMFLIGYAKGEFEGVGEQLQEIPSDGAWLILASCVVGTLIGYTGWLCRGMVSATTYTLVGVVNKFLTILINVFLWDKHASWFGLFCVTLCLLSGTFYEQAPKCAVVTSGGVSREYPRSNSPKHSEELQPLTKHATV